MRSLAVLLLGSFALAGCTTSGQKWVAETPRSTSVRDDRPLVLSEEEYHQAASPYRREVVRLGEVETVSPERNAASPASPSTGSMTQITNVYVGGPTIYSGYGYGYGRYPSYGTFGARSSTGTSRGDSSSDRAPTTVRPGADHPALPEYGPPMLTQTAPAPAFR